MRKPALAASASRRRQARTLAAALSVLLVGMALYANNVRAQAVGEKLYTPHPRDSLGSPTLATSAALATANAGESAGADLRVRPAPMTIAWTSPWGRVELAQRQTPIR